jgi:hypothetical protein
MFSNVILRYKAAKYFSKYLETFEIKEYNFRWSPGKSKKGLFESKKKYKKRNKEQYNDWIWYARFYFKEKPMKGYLNIIFK